MGLLGSKGIQVPFMVRRKSGVIFALMICLPALFFLSASPAVLAQEKPSADAKEPAITLPEDLGEAVSREAGQVREQLEAQARSLFKRSPQKWDWKTIDFLYWWILTLPLKIPDFVAVVMEQGRLLGAVGSLVVLVFLVAVFYSLIGQRRVLSRLEQRVQPLRQRIPEEIYPFFLSILRVMTASLLPLILLAGFSLIDAFIAQKTPWLLLTRRLLILWSVGALTIYLLRESLTRDLFSVTADYGKTIFRLSRLVVLYVLAGVGAVWGAEAFPIPGDVLAFVQFVISLSIVFVLFLLLLRKRAILSLLPGLPYPGYQSFRRTLERYYYPAMVITLVSGLLWCVGYKRFATAFWARTWAVAGAYVGIVLAYHLLNGGLKRWVDRKEASDEEARSLYRSARALLLYAAVIAGGLVILDLLGLLDPMRRILSFSLLKIGETGLSIWIFAKAGLILLAFGYVARFLQAYLDFKVYPSLGVDTGLAYALNTFFHYLILAIGVFVVLRVVGIDLRLLMVFAGAAGIGIGLGLQNMAANVISGFSIVFGRQIRKGDWIQAGETLGVVTGIYLRATQIRTRDNVEYLIPNAQIISSTIVNFTLSSPFIRIRIPVGVSYQADPRRVEEILLDCAQKHPEVLGYNKPEVFFAEYGESSINFELLVWIDIRKIAENRIKSQLYFTIFEALRDAGIEIPFPQRDVHLRSGGPQPEGFQSK